MGNVYIERNVAGQYDVKERGNPKPIATAPTQREAEEKVKQLFPAVRPDVERVRHTNKGEPDKWRRE
jgi:hypothetical protein